MARGRAWRGAAAGLALLGLSGCADYVGDDLRADGAVLARTPDPIGVDGATTTTLPPTPVDPRSLPDGACFDDVPDEAGTQPTTPAAIVPGALVVPRSCADDHRYEVVARGEVAPAEEAWPGAEPVEELTDTFCTARFEEVVGSEWAASSLDFVAIVPDEERWASGDRQVTCLVIDVGLAPVTGSAAGSRR